MTTPEARNGRPAPPPPIDGSGSSGAARTIARQDDSTFAEASECESAGVGTALETAVEAAIELHGPSLLFEPERLAELLHAEFPQSSHDIDLLLRALEREVPQDLLGAHSGEHFETNAARLAAGLAEQEALPPAKAADAVASWARILGVAAVGSVPGRSAADAAEAASVAAPDDHPDQPSLLEPPLFASAPVVVASPFDEPVRPNAEPPWPAERPMDGGGSEARGPDAVDAAPGRRRGLLVAAALIAAIVAAAVAWTVWNGAWRKSVTITAVASDGPLIGDGTKRALLVSFASRRTGVRQIESVFVRGDGAVDPKPVLVDVPPDAAARGIATAGTFAATTTRPTSATFRYVAIATDGTRSPPFKKTFEILAGPPQPPVIQSVEVPKDLVTGKPFALTVAFAAGADPVARLEIRVADSTSPLPPEPIVVDVAGLESPGPGVVVYPFAAGSRPSRSTLEVTLVDALGVRSSTERAIVDVRAPAPPKGLAGCSPSTCGRVVSVREADARTGVSGFFHRLFESKDEQDRKRYEVTIRLDNGALHALTDTTRWAPGARVRVVGSAVSLRCMESRRKCF